MNEKDVLMRDRYVKDDGKPLAAEDKPPYSEFKMMPIRMRLTIDQRKLAKLLTECANSAMPIEVRRVRLHPGMGETVDLGAMGGEQIATAMGGGAMGGGSVRWRLPAGAWAGCAEPMAGIRGEPMGGIRRPGPPGMEGGPRTPAVPLPGANVASELGVMDVPVEIQGIIYIYNPPDEANLGKRGEPEAGRTRGCPSGDCPGSGNSRRRSGRSRDHTGGPRDHTGGRGARRHTACRHSAGPGRAGNAARRCAATRRCAARRHAAGSSSAARRNTAGRGAELGIVLFSPR